ncbi:MAG: chitobiase/beta-hexosaminidase C-terminal domain-containing protein, partial [Verrucomicrobiota bacterium]
MKKPAPRTILPVLLVLSGLPGLLSADLRINEVLAKNVAGLVDKDGDGTDWIEIFNSGNDTVNLQGWFVTDDPDDLQKWSFVGGTVNPGGFYVVRASGKDINSIFSAERHTNFKLSSDGEFVGLVDPDGNLIDSIDPGYPEAIADVSYGIDKDGEWGYLLTPSPGAANSVQTPGQVGSVEFSVKRGYYDVPFMLELSSPTPDASISYTLDGKEPTLFTGKTYAAPIPIDNNTIVRARASKTGYAVSELKTHSYLFPGRVIDQDEMNPRITDNDAYRDLIEPALRALPAVSISGRNTNLSKTSEEPVSIEYVRNDGKKGFQIDGGVLRVGGHSLGAYPKNNMRLYFRSEYGKSKLVYPLFEDHPYSDGATDEFDRLQLRSGSHDTLFYLGTNTQSPSDAQYLRNRWISDMQMIMDHPSLHGRWVHVYINGTYWGHYQLMERPSRGHLAAYFGGEKEDYLATNKGAPVGGSDLSTWQAMKAARNDFEEFSRYADVDNYIDYMLLNFYGGNDWDWSPQQNWMAGGPLGPDAGGFKFYGWDSDIIFRRLNDHNLDRGGPEGMFSSLIKLPEFKQRFADRAYKHLTHGGCLTASVVARLYNQRAEEIRLSLVPETARWGSGQWDRDDDWQGELDRLNDTFFPQRTEVLIDQLEAKGWFRDGNVPGIVPQGGVVAEGSTITLSKSIFAPGTIYYTLDGSDPRLVGGAISEKALAYSGPFSLSATALVRTRVLVDRGTPEDNEWSAIDEAMFWFDVVPASAENLLVTQLNYRPGSPSEAEIGAGFDERSHFEFV